MVENVDSPTTLWENSHYDISESSIGRHLSVLALDLNHGRQNIKQSSFGGTSNTIDVSGFENEYGNESNVNLVRDPGVDGSKIVLYSELEHVPAEPKDGEKGEDEEEEYP
ncbi:hypothetical protein PVK06_002443 [Gossypium arboreum]|uniref:Uncharacterized protein n=1 Tax=Gossypium arboreum TaxID=29729 RepID=A0ABR0R4P4_GOSAR|nr:hypothetical protein PVK06_002443 [Gossypium arboreum]